MSNMIILVTNLVGQRVLLLPVYVPHCSLWAAVKNLFYDKLRVMTDDSSVSIRNSMW